MQSRLLRRVGVSQHHTPTRPRLGEHDGTGSVPRRVEAVEGGVAETWGVRQTDMRLLALWQYLLIFFDGQKKPME